MEMKTMENGSLLWENFHFLGFSFPLFFFEKFPSENGSLLKVSFLEF